MTETTLSSKTLNALSDLLTKHRSALRDELDKTINKLSGTTAGAMGGVGFAGNAAGAGIGGSLKEQRKELEKLIRAYGRNHKALSAHERYTLKSAKDRKAALDKLIEAEKAATSSTSDNTTARKKNTESVEEGTQASRRSAEGLKDFTKGLIQGGIAIKGFRELVDEIRTSYKLGFKWDPVSDALNGIMMGMNPRDMMEFQAQFRRTSGALSGGINQFNQSVADNQRQMLQYTGSMKAAAFAMGNMYELSHSMGLNFEDVNSSADSLFNQFKRMNVATSLTIDQFTDLTKSLVGDSDVRSKLLTLQKSQRAVYVQSLLKQHDMLQAQGMTYEAAQRLVKYMESNSNKDPLERMKQGAQMMNVARMLGFSPDKANRLMMLNNKRIKSADEAVELKGLLTDFTQRAHEKMGGGTDVNGIKTGELIVRRVLAATGLDLSPIEEAATQQSAVRDPVSVAIQQKEIQERQEDWLQKIYKEGVIISDRLGAWGTSAIGIAAGGALVALLSRKGSVIDSLMDKVFGGGSGGAGGTGGTGGGKWRKMLRGAVGRGGAAAGIGFAGLTASGFIDPSSMAPENQAAGSMAKSALQWGSTGASVGALFGPLGIAIGGAAGALVGVGAALYDSATDYKKHALDITSASTQAQSAEQARLIAEREDAKQRLELAQASGDMTEANRKTVEELTKKITGLNEQLSVEQKKTQLSMINSLGPAGQALLNGSIDSAAEIRDRASGMDMIAGQAGIKGTNSVQNWINAAYAQASKQGATGDADTMSKLTRFATAVQNGGDMDMPKELRRFFDPAGADALANIQRAGGSQYGSIISGMDSQSLSSLVNDSSKQSADLDKKIAELEQKKSELSQSPSLMDMFGMGDLNEALQIDKQIAEAKALKENQIKMAQGIEDALSGNRALSMNMSQETLDALAKLLQGKKPTSQSNAAVTQ